jgi:hypothetical protein
VWIPASAGMTEPRVETTHVLKQTTYLLFREAIKRLRWQNFRIQLHI